MQAALDRIEAADAHALLAQLDRTAGPGNKLKVARRWLRKHWTDGWMAAGGPAGAPEAEPAKAKAKGVGRG